MRSKDQRVGRALKYEKVAEARVVFNDTVRELFLLLLGECIRTIGVVR